ncbi:hypothetical protein AB5N19_02788 [Seiridium cardinale]|uniref:Transmembrane protein n=1 Tax=Seiridium cardinale TaxID=138064 RepID=A0ABR2XGG1_9PEZI
MKTLVASFLLASSAIFLITALALGEMRTKGITKVQFDIPNHKHRRQDSDVVNMPDLIVPTQLQSLATKLSVPSEVPDQLKSLASELPVTTTLPDVTSVFESFATEVATKVSGIASQTTSTLGLLLNSLPKDVTIGTDQLCFDSSDGRQHCQNIPSNLSALVPSPLDTLIDVSGVAHRAGLLLSIHVRSCLAAALAGVLSLAIVLVGFSLVDIGTLGTFSSIPLLRPALEAVAAILALLPLTLAGVVTFGIPHFLSQIEHLKVETGDLVWCLGVVIGLAGLAVVVLLVSCMGRRR